MKHLELPVYTQKDLILSALEKSRVIVVESPTGSGKTTQLPVILQQAGYGGKGIIGVTQPRRIAALSVSEFIARQMGHPLGTMVGYKMRFEDRTSSSTQIKIMTDGILLQEMKLDPYLSKYNCLIVDEAHERSLNIDFILGLLKRVLEERKEFKLIISSATINAAVFSEYFGQCPIVKIDAQVFPVTIIYDSPTVFDSSAIAEEALFKKILDIMHRFLSEDNSGDVLIFLPGEKMIKTCMSLLSSSGFGKELHLLPLYGRLGKEEQERVFEPTPQGKTKVIVSTNIAETSVTIDGITAVIDSGLSKLNHYNPRTFTSSLIEAPISKASANQRKGRAGRTGPGTCYRLYNRKDFEKRPLFTTEEIYRTDLSEVVLRMADLGITSFEEFDFLSSPGREGLIAAIETLMLLDALENDHSLSNIGKLMTEFPLAPRHSRIIVEAILKYPDVIYETIIAAAFLSTQSPYILPLGEEIDARRAHHRFRDEDGDFISYLKLLKAYNEAPMGKKFCEKNYLDERAMAEIANVVSQLTEIVSSMKIPVLSGGSINDYLSAISKGLIQFVCVRDGRELYRSLTAERILIHPGSVMFRINPEFIVAGEIVKTARMYAMSVSPLPFGLLSQISPALADSFKPVKKGKLIKEEKKVQKLKIARDFTNHIKIEGEVFEIHTVKGKKMVYLPWEKLRNILNDLNLEDTSIYKGLRGIVTIEGKYTLLRGEKLKVILSIAPNIGIEDSIKKTRHNNTQFNSGSDLDKLITILPSLAKPVLHKKDKKELGFTSLNTDGYGNYRFRSSPRFYAGLHESLASLETLISELEDDVDIGKKDIVNRCYRRLSDFLI